MSEPVQYQVWAIEYETRDRHDNVVRLTVAVSAESEYGAIKRLCGNRAAIVKNVALMPGRKPEYNERRIEGFIRFHWPDNHPTWEYT